MKVLVIGGGPGGYIGAIRLAQLGADVTIVEKNAMGGTCLNVGCIPTKVLIHSSELYKTLIDEGDSLGIEVSEIKLNWSKLLKRKQSVVKRLVGGIESLMKSNKVTVIKGEASFIDAHHAEIRTSTSKETFEFDKAIIATGSESIILPVEGSKLEGVLTSDEALSLETLPKSIGIIGGGVIGCEFAYIYSSLGVKVTVIEMLPNLIATMDQEIVDVLRKSLIHQGVDIHLGTKLERIDAIPDGLKILTDKGEFQVEKVLMATGRRPVSRGLNLEVLNLEMNRSAVKVNAKTMQTTIPSIYAVGDCNGGVLLAHVAFAEGFTAAEHIYGLKPGIDFKTTPFAVYTKPELASVGLTEEAAKNAGYGVKIGKFPLMANGKALILNEIDGLVKFVVDGKTDELLGIHMVGPKATELISEAALALRLEATVDEIMTTIHAHPTVSESFHEAAHAVHDLALHLPRQL
jgi:dihydrolipoamide dehydrogenase